MMFLLKCVEAQVFKRKQPACTCQIKEACDNRMSQINNQCRKAFTIQSGEVTRQKEGVARRNKMKKCGVCKQDKDEAMFYRRQAQLDGLQAYCKACSSIESATWREKHTAAHPLYYVWVQIIQRCTNPRHHAYQSYGGRGINVFTAWKDFSRFERDVMPLWKPGKQIDRIENDYGYYPGNIRFVSRKENCRNRRDNRLLTIGNCTRTSAEWSEVSGINYETLRARLANGWSAVEAVFTPAQRRTKKAARAGE